MTALALAALGPLLAPFLLYGLWRTRRGRGPVPWYALTVLALLGACIALTAFALGHLPARDPATPLAAMALVAAGRTVEVAGS